MENNNIDNLIEWGKELGLDKIKPKDFREPLKQFADFYGLTDKMEASTHWLRGFGYFVSYHSSEGSREPADRIVVMVDGSYLESFYVTQQGGAFVFTARPHYGRQ
jgi:hypothetical protein